MDLVDLLGTQYFGGDEYLLARDEPCIHPEDSSFGGVVNWNNSCMYLGVYFVSGRIFTCCFDHAKSQFSAHFILYSVTWDVLLQK